MTRFALAVLLLGFAPTADADFALRDGDTVVFLGDSITAAQTYGRIVENYTLLRFPDRKVRFVNSGWGGETAAGGLKRLQRDVFDQGATVLIVVYGVNDIGWGLHADEAHRQTYLNAISGLVEQCQAHGVRVFISSAAVTAADPETSEQSFLQTMCDQGMAIARARGEHAIDIQRTMRTIQRRVQSYNSALKDDKGKESLHVADGVHLSELGQRAMAFAILKGLGAPAEVSAVDIDAAEPRLIQASGCQVSDLEKSGDDLAFTRLDDGLPLNFGVFGALCYRFIPIPDELNRYMLTLRGLPDGKYTITAGDRPLGTFTSPALAQGVNLCSVTPDAWQPGGPWDAQAGLLLRLTDARGEVGLARRFASLQIPDHRNRPDFDTQASDLNARLETLQRTLVRPAPCRFLIRPASPQP